MTSFKIYKIINFDIPNKVYYGSTTQELKTRFNHHKCHQKCSSKVLFSTNNVSIHLVDVVKTKKDMIDRERWWIEIDDDCINFSIPNRTRAEYYLENKNKWENAKTSRIICGCGLSIRKNAIKKHLKSIKHNLKMEIK